jgi:uncharacterized protein YjbJ (UPF0337 family)
VAQDNAKGKANELAGGVRRKAGEVTGNEKMQAKGAGQQAKGKGQQAVGSAKDAGKKAKDAVKSAV